MRGYSQGSCELQKSYRRTVERTDGRTDGHQVFEQRAQKPHYTKISNKKNVSKFSRNMLTEIRCEICINHFVEIIFTLSCAVVDIHLLQINCSQNCLLKMCKKNCRHPFVDINNINVPGQRICSHFLVQIPRADAEIVTNKLRQFFFYLYVTFVF